MTAGNFVKLVSCDGHDFFVDEKIAAQCDVLKRMIENTEVAEGGKNKVFSISMRDTFLVA